MKEYTTLSFEPAFISGLPLCTGSALYFHSHSWLVYLINNEYHKKANSDSLVTTRKITSLSLWFITLIIKLITIKIFEHFMGVLYLLIDTHDVCDLLELRRKLGVSSPGHRRARHIKCFFCTCLTPGNDISVWQQAYTNLVTDGHSPAKLNIIGMLRRLKWLF